MEQKASQREGGRMLYGSIISAHIPLPELERRMLRLLSTYTSEYLQDRRLEKRVAYDSHVIANGFQPKRRPAPVVTVCRLLAPLFAVYGA